MLIPRFNLLILAAVLRATASGVGDQPDPVATVKASDPVRILDPLLQPGED